MYRKREAVLHPDVPGVQWGRGGVRNPEWTGPRLSDVLRLAGVEGSAKFLEIDGADTGIAQTPDFIRAMPWRSHASGYAARAQDERRSAASSRFPGAPHRARLGWNKLGQMGDATHCDDGENQGLLHEPGVYVPEIRSGAGHAGATSRPGSDRGDAREIDPDTPADQSRVPLAATTIRGFPWAGENAIERVDVSTDGGATWHNADLTPQKLPFAWRLFTLRWTPKQPGYYTIPSRATDTAGRVQPIVAAWNPSGYLWHSIDRVARSLSVVRPVGR
jgi:sulfite dehydrogenase (cytochrome) subunit A